MDLTYDQWLAVARLRRSLRQCIDLLHDGAHALENGRMHIVDEFLDRAATALEKNVQELEASKETQ